MASLFDTVKQNGQLMQVAKPDTASLAAAAQQKQPPSNPLSAATIGATPSMAAASAAPNGLQAAVAAAGKPGNAFQLATAPGADLGTAERRMQVTGQQTAAQAAATQAAQGLAPGANSLQGNVSILVASDYAKAAAAVGTVNNGVDLTKVGGLGLSTADQATVANNLASMVDPSLTPAQRDAAANKAYDTIYGAGAAATLAGSGAGAVAAALNANFMDQATVISNAVAGNMPTDVTVGDLPASAFGMQSSAQMDTLLGVQPGASGQMTIAQATSAISAKQAGSYNTAAQWTSILSDPTTSNALRATATQMLQAMGVTGARSAEASVKSLTQQVQSANTVTFQGQSMSIQQALSSPTVLATIQSLIPGSPSYDPTAAATMAADPNMASFATFVANNVKELTVATAGVTQEMTDIATATNQVSAIFSPYAGIPALQNMNPLAGGSTTATYDPSSLPPLLVAASTDMGMQGNVKGLFASDPNMSAGDQAAVLADPAGFAILFPATANGTPNTAAIAQFTANTQPATAANVADRLGATSALPLAGQVAAAKAAQAAGHTLSQAATDLLKVVVMNPDGTLNSAATATAMNASSTYAPVNARTLMSQGHFNETAGGDYSTLKQDVATASSGTDMMGSILTSIAGSSTGQPEYQNLMTGAAANPTGLSTLYDFAAAHGADKSTLIQIQQASGNAVNKAVTGLLGGQSATAWAASVSAVTDSQTATDNVTKATSALQAAQTQGLDSAIISELQGALQAAQAANTAIYNAEQAANNAPGKFASGVTQGSAPNQGSGVSQLKKDLDASTLGGMPSKLGKNIGRIK